MTPSNAAHQTSALLRTWKAAYSICSGDVDGIGSLIQLRNQLQSLALLRVAPMNVQNDGKARRAYIVVINLAILLIALLHAVEGGDVWRRPRTTHPSRRDWEGLLAYFQVFALGENYQSSLKFRIPPSCVRLAAGHGFTFIQELSSDQLDFRPCSISKFRVRTCVYF